MKISPYLARERLTASEFAEKARVSVSSISRMAAGKAFGTPEAIARIREASGGAITADDVLDHYIEAQAAERAPASEAAPA